MGGGIKAVTLDFFDTLVFHRLGTGRTRRLKEYLELSGYLSRDWEDESIYRVLARHDTEYSLGMSEHQRRRYLVDLALRVLGEAGVTITRAEAERHAEQIWAVLGPASFGVFPDAIPTLRALRSLGVRLAIVSNWHRGLAHYVSELGLGSYIDHVIGSADYGFAKPDPRIFDAARIQLGVPASAILHVGDAPVHDYAGARSAGLHAALLSRRNDAPVAIDCVIHSLHDILALPNWAASDMEAI